MLTRVIAHVDHLRRLLDSAKNRLNDIVWRSNQGNNSAVGGFAIGLLANGGAAICGVAQGGLAIGWLARGAQAKGTHVWNLRAPPDAATKAFFDQFNWLIGPSGGGLNLYPGVAWTLAIAMVVAVLALLPVVFIDRGRNRIEEELRRAPEEKGKDRR
jgi:hypothetical protein